MEAPSAETYSRLWAHVEPENSRRLLLAALDAFAEQGFDRATTRDIAMRAGMSNAAVYIHYRNKMDLLIEISRIGHQALLEHVENAISAFDSPPERLKVLTQAFATWQAEFHTLGRVTNYQIEELSEEGLAIIRPLRRRFAALVQGEIRRGIESRDFDVPDVRGTARAIISLAVDVSRWYSPSGATSTEQLGLLYGELALRMVQPWAA